jgi:proline dehydrogenase
MSIARSLLLAASQNRWLREHASRYGFVKKSVARFMPGETLDDAVRAARELEAKNIATVFTHLGENVADAREAAAVAEHYVKVLERIHGEQLDTEISVKPTQLGLDFSPEVCEQNLRKLFAAELGDRTLWIDMEASGYVDATLELYRKLLADFPNAGICLQAYLHRTENDIDSLLPLKPSVRLVKGAYSEPPEVAIQERPAVTLRYYALSKRLLRLQVEGKVRRAAFATHDPELIGQITEFAGAEKMARNQIEVQMLYGIQRGEQTRLAEGGWRSGVLIAYGDYWYPWFVRRLAERPANVWLLLRNLAGN